MDEMEKLDNPAVSVVVEFLGWLDEHPTLQLVQWLRLCEDGETPRIEPRLVPQQAGLQAVLYEYFEIDARALDRERRALLDMARQKREGDDAD